MNANDIKNEIKNGNTTRVRKAVRNALWLKVAGAIAVGFSADCDFDHLDCLVFGEDSVFASAPGVMNCRNHTFEVCIPFSDIK